MNTKFTTVSAYIADDFSKLVTVRVDENEREERKTYRLKSISEKTLLQKRLSGVPGFLAKINGMYYYTEVPSDFKLPSKFMGESHCCSPDKGICRNFIPISSADGGCDKVLDSCVTFQLRHGFKRRAAIINSHRLEKYPWITRGYETFNIPGNVNAFLVAECARAKLVTTYVPLRLL